jgi:hypothetical protein
MLAWGGAPRPISLQRLELSLDRVIQTLDPSIVAAVDVSAIVVQVGAVLVFDTVSTGIIGDVDYSLVRAQLPFANPVSCRRG